MPKLKDKVIIDYSKYSIDELLDERNYLKSQGLYTEEIDMAMFNNYIGYFESHITIKLTDSKE